MGSRGFNKKKAKKNIEDTNSALNSMYTAISKVSENLKKLMAGDGEDPYWNGEEAKNYYEQGIANLNNMIKYYNKVRKHYGDYAVVVEQIISGDKKVK